MEKKVISSRRGFLKNSAFALTALTGATVVASNAKAAAMCAVTTAQPEGPFYPVVNQLDKDTDLTTVAGRTKQALGKVVWVQGTVSDQDCVAVGGVLVEIWQACATGKYNHPNDPNTAALDPDFQYWGRAITDQSGFYRFKTIVPGAYPAGHNWIRPPHIHFRVLKRGYHELITQMYFAGEAHNETDLILKALPKADQEHAIVQFVQGAAPEPVGTFDLRIKSVSV